MLVVFLIWVFYIQIMGWRRTRGYPAEMEMTLADRFREEVVYQVCYRRGYRLRLEMNADGHWNIRDTDHPSRRAVKILAFWSMLQVLLRPYSFRSLKLDDFDDYDPRYDLPESAS
jgi:hypothetical protein